MDALIEALRDPACYPHPAPEVMVMETHISWVLLAGGYAYKIKKPLNLGFVDFSTLQRRRHFCTEELRLNRRLAQQLYLAVVPVTGSRAHPRMGGSAPAIEYAVQMRRFPQQARLDHRLADGNLSGEDIDAVSDHVAAFHRRSAVDDDPAGYGTPDAVHRPVRDNFDQIRPLLEHADSRRQLENLAGAGEAAFQALRDTLAARKRAGAVRECHGDLHLGNLVALPEGITAFDCIEFNPDLRWIDVISDVAFLAMDLVHRGHQDLAFRFLNGYLQATGDYPGAAVLPYYLAYRAMVRAKVAAISRSQHPADAPAGTALEAEYQAYVDLAAELATPRGGAVIITHGLSGSGKTWLTDTLVQALPALRVRSDVERKRLHGLAADAGSGSAPGEGIYTPQATERTYGRLADAVRTIAAAGYTAIADAAFLDRTRRGHFAALARDLGVPFMILDCRADESVLRERVRARQETGSDASEADLAVLERQLAADQSLDDAEHRASVSVDTTNPQAPAQALNALRARVAG